MYAPINLLALIVFISGQAYRGYEISSIRSTVLQSISATIHLSCHVLVCYEIFLILFVLPGNEGLRRAHLDSLFKVSTTAPLINLESLQGTVAQNTMKTGKLLEYTQNTIEEIYVPYQAVLSLYILYIAPYDQKAKDNCALLAQEQKLNTDT